MKRAVSQRGFSLVEIIVALAIFAIVIAGVSSFFITQSGAMQRVFRSHAALADEEAFFVIGRDLRSAVAVSWWQEAGSGDSYLFLVEPVLGLPVAGGGGEGSSPAGDVPPVGLAVVTYVAKASSGELQRWSWDDLLTADATPRQTVTVARQLEGFTAEPGADVAKPGGAGTLSVNLAVMQGTRKKTYTIEYAPRNAYVKLWLSEANASWTGVLDWLKSQAQALLPGSGPGDGDGDDGDEDGHDPGDGEHGDPGDSDGGHHHGDGEGEAAKP